MQRKDSHEDTHFILNRFITHSLWFYLSHHPSLYRILPKQRPTRTHFNLSLEVKTGKNGPQRVHRCTHTWIYTLKHRHANCTMDCFLTACHTWVCVCVCVWPRTLRHPVGLLCHCWSTNPLAALTAFTGTRSLPPPPSSQSEAMTLTAHTLRRTKAHTPTCGLPAPLSD